MKKHSTPDHAWPADPAEHMWGPWFWMTRTSQYRTCVHPDCKAVDRRSGAKA